MWAILALVGVIGILVIMVLSKGNRIKALESEVTALLGQNTTLSAQIGILKKDLEKASEAQKEVKRLETKKSTTRKKKETAPSGDSDARLADLNS